ncbi:hypothetical protein E4T38_05376 [Aureobasidium subglaciale]|nr:hypothetical protein E4T38_05376 [Aureobasidium subglaciale]KAI5221838.1 hypothetical protein E4T40_05309 [Aureobasidium subglaciale]KAI5225760.1 hypothetical protein E4T41_05128 [Aureobasidium subglaciale]KAI5261575.1 hypothetical protein E4T46_05020 [Aureobasidium subglaciale]
MARINQPAGQGKTATGLGGKGLGKSTAKRHRRMARRGGVKRISGSIYDEVRIALQERLRTLLQDICAVLECTKRKTVTVPDVVFILNRHGIPIYGFDAPFRTRN